ncbi:unnamed protein product [Diamesa serratosioi]
MASPMKRMKTDKKAFFSKQARTKNTFRQTLEPGIQGFLASCNFREKDCVRESYRLLNEYADEMYGKANQDDVVAKPEEEEEDISSQLENQIEKTKFETKQKAQRFQSVDTGIANVIFIKTTLENHQGLGVKIIRDLHATKAKKSRSLLRFIPIEAVCKAKIDEIINAAGPLFDKYFLKEPSTFSIIFNHRYNNDLKRDLVIKELADIIALKNIGNKVNLKQPQLSVVVEVMKGICCLAVLPDFHDLRKYNLNELHNKPIVDDEEPAKDDTEEVKIVDTDAEIVNKEDVAA